MKVDSLRQLIYAADIMGHKNNVDQALAANDLCKAQEACKAYIVYCEAEMKEDYVSVLEDLKDAYTRGIDVAKKSGNNDVAGDLETRLNKLPASQQPQA